MIELNKSATEKVLVNKDSVVKVSPLSGGSAARLNFVSDVPAMDVIDSYADVKAALA